MGKPPHEILDYYSRSRTANEPNRRKDKTPGYAALKTICFVVVYFGKWPPWFPAFLRTCGSNPTINWIFFTDCGPPEHYPANVVFHNRTLAQMRKLIKNRIGKEATLKDAYKIPDYKPAFGFLFAEYLGDFDFWGHCDIDIIWGNIRKYATEEILDKYDIFSTRKRMISGHFSLFRNTFDVNKLFRQSSEFAEVIRQTECNAFDEDGMTRLITRLAQAGSIRVYWPKFLQNYASQKTDTPSKLPRYINKYLWTKGKLFDCTGKSPAEILYLHFMTWKKTLSGCEFGYGVDPEKFYISYCKISMRALPDRGP